MKKRFRNYVGLAFLSSVGLLTVACSETGADTSSSSNTEKVELKEKLTPLQYKVTMEDGTEPAFKNKYWDNKEPGIYVCVISGEPLFSSKDKFKSGTGWPSFTRPIDKNSVVEKADNAYGMTRTEVRGKKADSHLGHIFDDGPEPTGLRYCLNSAALRFVPVDKLKEEGLEKFVKDFKGKETE